MSSIFKALLYLALVILVVMVATWNDDQRVDVTYFPGRVLEQVPVFLVILGSVFIGLLIAGMLGAAEHLRHRFRERELRRQIEALESEVRDLRNMPISELEPEDESTSWTETE